MKKILILVLLFSISFAYIGLKVYADSTAIGLGFSVDSTQYGSAKDYKFSASYSYIVKNGKSYTIGYSKIKSAAYQDVTDVNWALVILQSTADPKDVKIPSGIINILFTYDGVTHSQEIYSDIDNCSVTFGYGAYITSANFLMEQPSPRDEPSTTLYTASIEVSEETKVSGSITFEDSEFDLDFNHSASSSIFSVDYLYSASLFDTSYMNTMTYNKGTFLIDMSTPNSTNAGIFVNIAKLTTQFNATSIFSGGSLILLTTPLSVTVYY